MLTHCPTPNDLVGIQNPTQPENDLLSKRGHRWIDPSPNPGSVSFGIGRKREPRERERETPIRSDSTNRIEDFRCRRERSTRERTRCSSISSNRSACCSRAVLGRERRNACCKDAGERELACVWKAEVFFLVQETRTIFDPKIERIVTCGCFGHVRVHGRRGCRCVRLLGEDGFVSRQLLHGSTCQSGKVFRQHESSHPGRAGCM